MTKLRQNHGAGSRPGGGSPGGGRRVVLSRRFRRDRPWSLVAGDKRAVGAVLLSIVTSVTLLNVIGVSPASGTVVAAKAAAAPYLYVINSDSVTEYAKGADGDQAPVATIKGDRTGLSDPAGVAVDSQGNVFVSNRGNNTVTEYASGAHGDQAPMATIKGPNTGLNRPRGLAIDGGELFVSNYEGCSITRYAVGGPDDASGDVRPRATLHGLATRLRYPTAVAVGNGLLYVANWAGHCFDGRNFPYYPYLQDAVTVYRIGTTGNSEGFEDLTGLATDLFAPSGLAVDTEGNLFVSNQKGNSVTEYAPGAHGNQKPIAVMARGYPNGGYTKLYGPSGVAVNSGGDLFVSNEWADSITEYGPGAHSDWQKPIAIIWGDKTGLRSPKGVALAPRPVTPPALPPR